MTRIRPYRDSDYPALKALVRKLFPGGEPPPSFPRSRRLPNTLLEAVRRRWSNTWW